jgi:type IV pilus assembly protein PilE
VNPVARAAFGYSLLEIMIVLALVAILLTLAVPAYRDQSVRVYRSIAVTQLMQAASCQAQRQASQGYYDTGACQPADSEHYGFRYLDPGDAQAQTYTLLAEPRGRQLADGCGWLGLDHAGAQQVGHEQAGTAKCWSGR